MNDIHSRVQAYVAECDRVTRDHMSAKYPNLKPDTHEARQTSNKWVKVTRITYHAGSLRSESVHSFIAISDFSNKKLGDVKTGDIHMAASFCEPAKHARGSVFADDFGGCITPYGVAYLKDLRR